MLPERRLTWKAKCQLCKWCSARGISNELGACLVDLFRSFAQLWGLVIEHKVGIVQKRCCFNRKSTFYYICWARFAQIRPIYRPETLPKTTDQLQAQEWYGRRIFVIFMHCCAFLDPIVLLKWYQHLNQVLYVSLWT